MTKSRPPFLPTEPLALQWQWLAKFAVFFARTLLRLSEKNPRAAFRQIESFEVWLAAALGTLAQQISTSDNAEEADTLHAMTICLTALLLVVHTVKRAVAAKLRQLPVQAHTPARPDRLPAMVLSSVPYLDSS